MQLKKKELKTGELEYTITPTKDNVTHAQEAGLQHLGEEVTVPGFRKGHAPTLEVKKRVGEHRLLQETLDHLIEHTYHHILENEKIFPLMQPEVNFKGEETLITDNPQLTITFTIVTKPEVKLPDYKKIGVSYEKPIITPEQTEEALKGLFERWKEDAGKAKEENGKPSFAEASKGKQKSESEIVTATSLEDAKQQAGENKIENQENITKATKENPDNEWAQSMGANDLEDLKKRLHQNLILEQTYMLGNKFTQEVLDKLIEKTSISVPEKVVMVDLKKQKERKEKELEKIGMNLDGFAKQQKTNVANIEKEWRERIEKEYKLEFALDAVAKQENVTISDQEIDAEIKGSRDPNASKLLHDPDRREHLRYLMRRDKAVRKLVEWNMSKEETEKGD